MDSQEDIETVKDLQQFVRSLRRTGILLAVLALTTAVVAGFGGEWRIYVVATLTGIITATGVRQAVGAHAVLKEIDSAALGALFTPRRTR